MVTEAQKRANAKYRKKMQQVTVRFSPREADVYEFIRSHENASGYIKELVRADMERQRRP